MARLETLPQTPETDWYEVTPGERFTIRTSSKATNGAYMMLEVVAAPGNGVPVHIHDHEEEHFIIVEGMARILNGDEMLDVPAGATATVRRGVRHAWCNLGAVPLRMLVVFTPGQIEGLFRAVAARASGDDIGRIASGYGTHIVGPPLQDVHSIVSPRSRAG